MGLEKAIHRVAEGLMKIGDAGLALAAESALWRKNLFPSPPTPGDMSFDHVSERTVNDMDLHKYRANFPPTPAGTDITTLEFRVLVDGQASTFEGASQDLGPDATSAEFEAPEATSATVTLAYVDNAGNRSAVKSQTFTVLDDIAPDAPGDFGAIEHLGERTE